MSTVDKIIPGFRTDVLVEMATCRVQSGSAPLRTHQGETFHLSASVFPTSNKCCKD